MDCATDPHRPLTPIPAPPKISIIIPCFNSAATLKVCLESVVALDRPEIEVVIIDGGSSDSTLGIIEHYRHRIHYCISEPDNGIYDAMNKGVRASRGQWLLFLGSDDVIHPDFVQVLDRMVDPSAVYHGDVILLGSGHPYGGKFNSFRIQFENICHQAMLYPRVAFEERAYDTRYRVLGDHEFNMYCMGRLGLNFRYLPILFSIYNDTGGASFRAHDIVFEKNRVHLAFSYFNWPIAVYAFTRLSAFRLKLRLLGATDVPV